MSFVTHKENGVTFHTSTLLENGAVRHGFSTRLGGVSKGVYASLNLRRHGNPPDAPDLVDENYRRFCAAVGVDTAGLALSRQVHEDTVRHVTAGDAGKGFSRPVDYTADALVTDVPGLQLMVFSATIPENLQPFLKKYLHNPEIITIDTNEEFQSDVTNYLVPARHMSYEEKLLQILPAINPYIALIFANTTEEAAQVAEGMRREGYDLVELHSGMESRARAQAIRQIQSQKKSYIVASDIASRGIDLEGISHVISLGFPKDLKFFFHRIGRTGRAGRDGLAITIYQDSDRRSIDSLAHKGVQWKHKNVKRGQWVDLKPLEGRKRKGTDPLQAEISRIVKAGKKERVKPNYKKKQKQQIEQLRRKRKWQIIQEDIRRQKKERAKEKQKARRQGSK